MGIVLAFSVYFYIANGKQSKGKKLIERTVSSIWCPKEEDVGLTAIVGRIQVYVLGSQIKRL